MDNIPRILHSSASLFTQGQPRLVMLERPPGGATMRWPVRLGLLSSIWAPERDRRRSFLDETC
jgi:hypothetical protein